MPLRLIPLFLALAWGLNWPAVKMALAEFPPFTLRALGLGSAGLLLLLLALLQRKPLLVPRAAWPGVLLGGLLAVALFNMSTAFAQLSTSTSRAAVLTFTMPMMSVLLAWWLLGEKPSRTQSLALALGMAGIAVLAWPVLKGVAGDGPAPPLRGLLLPLLAAFGWAAGTVGLKRWPVQADRMTFTAWQLLLGAACGVLGAVLVGEAQPPWPPSAPVATALFFHIVAGTALAYWLWFILAERVSATVSSLTTLAVPVVGVAGAMLLVGDRPSGSDWLGFVLVLAGAAMTMLQLRRGG
ncbi:DMT family transporter [Pseudorhodoferax sp.]|uniref:DMT family transporter n=1 Tax=Pseudorhodoferax sp. TaxID=1993553 RepID=UPI002DD66ABC|nr:DMT family transporter [Pseudorhodoferax sp.]